MNNYTFEHNGFTFKRVNRNTAKTAYKNGLYIVLCPVNLRPFGTIYNAGVSVRYSDFYTNEKPDKHFDSVVNSFEYYNRVNNETGRYTAFYIPVVTDKEGCKTYDYDYLKTRLK